MRSICTQGSRDIFDGNVCIKEMYDECITTEKSMLYNSSWDRFVNDLKIKNRFHSDSLNLKILERFISYIPKKYKKGTHFYRARIGDSPKGYKVNEMSAPPASKSNEGRANAKGITCLYLASNLETTLHEVRATSYDYVSVGDFELKDDITVVDLKRLNQISPFIENLNVLDYAINQEYLDRYYCKERENRHQQHLNHKLSYSYFNCFISYTETSLQQNKSGLKIAKLYPEALIVLVYSIP